MAVQAGYLTMGDLAGLGLSAATLAEISELSKKKKKKSKSTGKEKGNDKPSWGNPDKAKGTTPRQKAEDMCDGKFGKGKYNKRGGGDFSKWKKYFEREKHR